MLKLFKDVFKIKTTLRDEGKKAAKVVAKEEEKTEAMEEMKAETKARVVAQIGPNLFLYTTRVEEPFSLILEVANMLPMCFDFKFDFFGSENIQAFDGQDVLQDLHLAERITPFSIKTLGTLKKTDPLAEKTVEFKMSLEVFDEDLDKTTAAAAKQMSLVAAEVAKQAADPEGDHDYFIDTTFPPCRYSSSTSDMLLKYTRF